jgi:ubiquinone/menaquinone biosynthesis C-methylase UbiE
LDRRDGGDDAQRAVTAEFLAGIRERVLGSLRPLDGATILDVGTGDGLIGLAALGEVGPGGSVIFSDVSAALLERCRAQVSQRDLLDSARFVQCGAEELHGIADASVDVITTRSVLIYVADKPAAFAAFARVLAPHGRLSLFEPINRLMYPEPPGRFLGYDVHAVDDLAAKVTAQFAGDPEAREAMVGFDDRDLVSFAVDAGFASVRVERVISVTPASAMSPVSFDALLGAAPNPNAPTVREAIEAALGHAEQARFIDELHRAYRAGDGVRRWAGAYLTATLN